MIPSPALSFPALRSAVDEHTTSFSDKLPANDDVTISAEENDKFTTKIENTVHKNVSTKPQSSKMKKSINIKAEEGQKSPGLSYIALISMAIQSTGDQKMLLSEIYQWIADRYPFYQMKDKSWRNSIRHNLSLNECFVKSGRSENGKGNYWSIHPANIEDFSKGDYRRRRARRRVRKCDEDLQRLCSNSPETPPSSPPAVNNYNGYVPMISTLVPSNFLSALGADTTRTRDEWFSSGHYPYQHYDHKYRDQNLNYCQSYLRSNNSPSKTGVHYFGHHANPTESATIPPAIPNESTFNVNVNVNVCGNTGSSQQHVGTDHITPSYPSYSQQSCPQSPCSPQIWQDLPNCFQNK